jgi:sulfite reductase (ferredoxin)
MIKKLDITDYRCPMTLVAVKYGLARIACGDVLDVSLLCGEPLENIPRAVSEQGHKVLEIRQENEKSYRVVIEKGTNT